MCRAAAVGLGKLAESPSDPLGGTPAVLLLAAGWGSWPGGSGYPCCSPAPAISGGCCRRHSAGASGQPLAEPWESSALSSPGLCWGEQPRGVSGRALPLELQGPQEEVGGFGGGRPAPSPRMTRGCWDARPRAGWCSRARWAEEERVEAALPPCCSFPFPPRPGCLLGAFPRAVFRPGALRGQLPPASRRIALHRTARRQRATGLCLFPSPGSLILRRPRS